MKNVIWLFAVCLSLGFYACSTNSNEKVANEAENSTLVEENTDVPDEMNSTENDLASEETADGTEAAVEPETETEEIAENTTKEEDKKKATSKPTRKADPSGSISKDEAIKSNPPKSISTSTPVKNVVHTPKKDDKVSPPPPPKPAQPIKKDVEEKPAPQLDHGPWNSLLKSNVSSSGVVDYAAFKRKKSELEAYLKHLEAFSPQSGWSNDKKLAYWINLYNAWTVKTIIDNYPVASITDIDGGKTWNVKRVKSGGKTYSLDEVENKIIRPRFNDARIHFAVNCAAKSCPPLMNKAWTASSLNRDLDKMTKSFINDSKHNTIAKDKVVLSKIFEWYAVDFGDLIPYLNKYSNVQINKNAKIEYHEYDWKLNGK